VYQRPNSFGREPLANYLLEKNPGAGAKIRVDVEGKGLEITVYCPARIETKGGGTSTDYLLTALNTPLPPARTTSYALRGVTVANACPIRRTALLLLFDKTTVVQKFDWLLAFAMLPHQRVEPNTAFANPEIGGGE